MANLSVLLIGRHDQAEFRDAVRSMAAQTDLLLAPTVESAIELVGRDEVPPDVIVVVQSHPGQHSHEQIDRLRRSAPLTPMIALLGSWCEGEARSGRPWPGVPRIYWHQWRARCEPELKRFTAGHCPTWGLPLTSTPDEWIDYVSHGPLPRRQGLIAIRARHAATYEALADACRAVGYSTVWLRPGHDVQLTGATAVLWDDACCERPQAVEIARLAEAVRPAPMIALLHFPRVQDHDRALAAGAAGVVSKPFLLDDLFWQLDRAVQQNDAKKASQGAA